MCKMCKNNEGSRWLYVRGRERVMMDRLRVIRIFSILISHMESNSSLKRAWKLYLQLGNLDQERHRASCLIRTNPFSVPHNPLPVPYSSPHARSYLVLIAIAKANNRYSKVLTLMKSILREVQSTSSYET